MHKKSRTKGYAFKAIIIALGLFVGLFFGELVLRAWLFGSDVFAFRKVNSFRPIGNSGHIQAAKNWDICYELKPNLDTWFKLQPLKTNSNGLRDQHYSFQKPKNTIRVAVIGDSFTFGDGVAIEDVYHSVLEKQLNELSVGQKFEFINFGVGGYNLLNYEAIMKEKILDYEPDLILLGFCGNNDDELPNNKHGAQKYKVKTVNWWLHHSQIIRTVNEISKAKRRDWRRSRNTNIAAQKAYVEDKFEVYRSFSQQHQIPIALFYLTLQDTPKGHNIWVGDLAQKKGFDFIDASPEIDQLEDVQQYWIHSTDGHPNAEIHAKYAEILMPYFVSKLKNISSSHSLSIY